MKTTILLLSVLTTALMAGLFFAWSVSVMPGLKMLPDREFIMSMQSMNKAIQNPMFFTVFFGAAITLVISCFLYFDKPLQTDYYLLLSAAILYLAGIMGVTMFGNVPLNEMLDKFDLQQSGPESLSALRNAFEAKWNMLNTIRTVSSTVSICLLIMMLMLKK